MGDPKEGEVVRINGSVDRDHQIKSAHAAQIASRAAAEAGITSQVSTRARVPRSFAVLIGVTMTMTLIAVLSVGWVLTHPTDKTLPPWEPLGFYPIQVVQDRVEGYESPTVLFSQGFVSVVGSKTNTTDKPVKVKGRLSWNLIDPPGGSVSSSAGESERAPGVTTINYENQWPSEVAERVRRLHRLGDDTTVWQIRGADIPYRVVRDPNHEGRRRTQYGVEASWQSQNFTIIYDL